jgi:hypothetical protein
MWKLSVLFVLTAGCFGSSDGESRSSINSHPDGEAGCKLEGAKIGDTSAKLVLGHRTVRFIEWTPKQGSPGEYVGFKIAVTGAPSVDYVVKAATQTFSSSASTWLHPDGQAGHAISNIDFCDECEDNGCEPCEPDEPPTQTEGDLY